MENNKPKRRYLFIFAIIFLLVIAYSVSYAYFSAVIKKYNETETKVKSNVLGLIYTGVTDININDIVPGDHMIKTFTVENKSNRTVDFNIYMEGIVNEFNADLVYTIVDDNGTVVAQKELPATNTGKTYLKTKIDIDAAELKSYTMTITFLYKDENQNINQNRNFKGTVGIDTERINEVEEIDNYSDGSIVYFNPTTNTKCNDYVAENSAYNNYDGCLRFYTVNHNKTNDTVDLVLDHNLEYYYYDENGKTDYMWRWNDEIQSNVKLITKNTVNKLENLLDGTDFWCSDENGTINLAYKPSTKEYVEKTDMYDFSDIRATFNISTTILE